MKRERFPFTAIVLANGDDVAEIMKVVRARSLAEAMRLAKKRVTRDVAGSQSYYLWHAMTLPRYFEFRGGKRP